MVTFSGRARRSALVLAMLLLACLLPGHIGSSSAAAAYGDPCGTRVRKATGGYWTCTFADAFNGTTLDSSKWVPQDTAVSGFTTPGNECYVKSSNNIFVRDGRLNLVARRESQPMLCKSPYGDFTTTYTGAAVATWGKFAQTYGRFEFRAKFPDLSTPGLHSAAWLYPQKHTYGVWPKSGEIDVAEFFTSSPTAVYPSLHYPGRGWDDTGWDCAIANPAVFNTYTVEWTSRSMRFLYNGALCYERSWSPTDGLVTPQPFDHPFVVTLTQAVGGGWNAVTDATPLPGVMQIDHVKVWR